ncbi:transcriptional regulator, TetR family [Stanieria cyanosphaera PCC 7437]|uniref:Transcriptional regulator, TetR family n=1 Tax=Stanieria cyanosphaera (strain ATCC 29371 / PCC 7437) TaxID=111780 RepID=K9XZB9_STAC7|nr:TetR family transcriptional regulator [Stanieria cyanosphaera]AFZ37007.1 transcriptional regulator, TetR family [Stanieria cyanosphaera PCC 7437]
MSAQKKSTKTRLIEAALDLFAEKGVTETTTKAVAERAQVNEVTLFRHFGNKHGLLLAVMEDSAMFARLGKALVEQANSKESVSHALKDYAKVSLQALERVPELVRSLVGEAGQYPVENRLALGRGVAQANTYIAQHLAKAIAIEGLQSRFPPEKLASLLNGLLLGYFVINSISEGDPLWEGQDDFLESLMELFLQGAILSPIATSVTTATKTYSAQVATVTDLPANLVHSIFQQAKKQGRQDYALVYLLFGAGLSPQEVINLKRSHLISEPQQYLLEINGNPIRQVPLNQWIMGKRYGFSQNNPLTQWLKSRKDNQLTMFINQEQQPLSESELQALWQDWTEGLLTPQGESPSIEQTRQTWCVEMLLKGIELEDLSILSGIEVEDLQPYARRAREKLAIEQAHLLDQKP